MSWLTKVLGRRKAAKARAALNTIYRLIRELRDQELAELLAKLKDGNNGK